jgi:rfaE bifunctional protein nucleotidyltransferase chain/domain
MRTTKTVVFTNGVFDLYHAGHINLLNQARSHGDVLIVGIPDDRTVGRLKGQERPVWPAEHRERVVASHPGVTTTIIYSGSISAILRAIRPDVLVRGEDQRLDGAEHAGRIVRVPRTPNISTTDIINGLHRIP